MGEVNLLSFELILFIVLVQWSQALPACRPVFINTRRSLSAVCLLCRPSESVVATWQHLWSRLK